MSLYDTVAASHRGQCFALLGRRFRLDDMQVADLVYVMLKELTASLDLVISERKGLIAFLDDLGQGDYVRMLADQSVFSDQRLRDRGLLILGKISEVRPLDREAIEDMAALNYSDAATCRQMLPYVSMLMMAAIRQRAERPMRLILAAQRGDRAAQLVSDPFGTLASKLAEKAKPSPQRPVGRLVDALLGRGRTTIAPRHAAGHPVAGE
jgi:hypothetical protein